MSDNHVLEQELKTYDQNRSRLLVESEGRFVVISGEQILGTWDTYEDALQAGYNQCGLNPFLVKRIERVEEALIFTRDLPECQS